MPFIKGKKLTGTARYLPINVLKECEKSRKDDLESIGYIIMYFISWCHSWIGLKANKKKTEIKKNCEIILIKY